MNANINHCRYTFKGTYFREDTVLSAQLDITIACYAINNCGRSFVSLASAFARAAAKSRPSP